MAKIVGFSPADARRIGAAVKRVEHLSDGDATLRRGHRPRSSAGGAAVYIVKTTGRTGARAYTVDVFSRFESDFSVSNDYRTATAQVMNTPMLNDTAAADQLANGTIFLAVKLSVGGTVVYIPTERVGLA